MPPFNRKLDQQSESNVLAQVGLRLREREPVNVDLAAVTRQSSLNAALVYCVGASGLDRKQVYTALGIDAATWSRIESAQAHFPLNKIEGLMDICGNEAPLMWLLNARGYDWASVREKQTEMERRVADLQQENSDLKRLFRLQSQLGTAQA
jgi:hypothetical protein